MSGTQPPQSAPAAVHCLIAPTVVKSCSRITEQISPLVTLLQEQIFVLSAMPAESSAVGSPTRRAAGCQRKR